MPWGNPALWDEDEDEEIDLPDWLLSAREPWLDL
jgi:hypothetical protein